jgi:hypothetical protein
MLRGRAGTVTGTVEGLRQRLIKGSSNESLWISSDSFDSFDAIPVVEQVADPVDGDNNVDNDNDEDVDGDHNVGKGNGEKGKVNKKGKRKGKGDQEEEKGEEEDGDGSSSSSSSSASSSSSEDEANYWQPEWVLDKHEEKQRREWIEQEKRKEARFLKKEELRKRREREDLRRWSERWEAKNKTRKKPPYSKATSTSSASPIPSISVSDVSSSSSSSSSTSSRSWRDKASHSGGTSTSIIGAWRAQHKSKGVVGGSMIVPRVSSTPPSPSRVGTSDSSYPAYSSTPTSPTSTSSSSSSPTIGEGGAPRKKRIDLSNSQLLQGFLLTPRRKPTDAGTHDAVPTSSVFPIPTRRQTASASTSPGRSPQVSGNVNENDKESGDSKRRNKNDGGNAVRGGAGGGGSKKDVEGEVAEDATLRRSESLELGANERTRRLRKLRKDKGKTKEKKEKEKKKKEEEGAKEKKKSRRGKYPSLTRLIKSDHYDQEEWERDSKDPNTKEKEKKKKKKEKERANDKSPRKQKNEKSRSKDKKRSREEKEKDKAKKGSVIVGKDTNAPNSPSLTRREKFFLKRRSMSAHDLLAEYADQITEHVQKKEEEAKDGKQKSEKEEDKEKDGGKERKEKFVPPKLFRSDSLTRSNSFVDTTTRNKEKKKDKQK